MEFFNRIKNAFGLKAYEVFRRWPETELNEKKAYLESKPPENFTTEDHYLAAEWVIQRYLPKSENPTPAQWSKVIGNIREKIDLNLKKTISGELPKAGHIQSEVYVLTKEDFLIDVVPTFKSFDLLPAPHMKDNQGKKIWESLFEFTQPYSYKHGEARDALALFCDTYLIKKLIQDLARTYITLRKAQLQGSTRMKVNCSNKQCSKCMAMHGKNVEIEEALASFRNGTPLFPHSLHKEEMNWCPAPYIFPEIALEEGEDPEFHEWLVSNLSK